MSQTFYDANKRFLLLHECDRVLAENGGIVIIGEHNMNAIKYIRRFASELFTHKNLTFNFYELFKPNPVLGDHYYRVSDYYFLFKSMGYTLKHKKLSSGNLMLIADKI